MQELTQLQSVKGTSRPRLEVVTVPPEAPVGRHGHAVVGLHKEHIILMTASLLLILHVTFPIQSDPFLFFTSALFYLFAVPVMIIHFLLHSDLASFGFTLGRWPFRAGRTILSLLLVGLLLFVASSLPEFRSYYLGKVPLDPGHLFVFLFLNLGFYFFAWEFFFRGYLLFGLMERFGAFAIVLQEVPFALMHIGKPSLEALSAGLAGLLFGYISYRSGSFLPAFLIHWAMNILLMSLTVYS